MAKKATVRKITNKHTGMVLAMYASTKPVLTIDGAGGFEDYWYHYNAIQYAEGFNALREIANCIRDTVSEEHPERKKLLEVFLVKWNELKEQNEKKEG